MLYVSHCNFVPGRGPHRHPVKLVSDLAIFRRFFVLFLFCLFVLHWFLVLLSIAWMLMYIVFSPNRSCAAFFLSRAFQRVASFPFSLFSLLSLHRMRVPVRTVDTSIYRARIGNFHTRAAALGRKLAFLDQSTLILISSNCSDRLVFATFVHFCLRYTFSTQDLPLRLAYKTKPNSSNKSGSLDDHPAKQNRMFF